MNDRMRRTDILPAFLQDYDKIDYFIFLRYIFFTFYCLDK